MRALSGRCAGNSGKEKEIQMPFTKRYRPVRDAGKNIHQGDE
jgi:hypothetical protein